MSDAVWIAVVGQVGIWVTILIKAHVDNLRYRAQIEGSRRAAQDRDQIKKRIDENTVVTAGLHPGVPGVKADLATVRAVASAAFDRLRETRSPGYTQGDPIAEATEGESTGAAADRASAGEGVSQPDPSPEGGSDRPDHLGGDDRV